MNEGAHCHHGKSTKLIPGVELIDVVCNNAPSIRSNPEQIVELSGLGDLLPVHLCLASTEEVHFEVLTKVVDRCDLRVSRWNAQTIKVLLSAQVSL